MASFEQNTWSQRTLARLQNKWDRVRRNLGYKFSTPPVPRSQTSNLKFSVVMPVFNTPPQFLQRAIDSVLTQTHKNFELCICDDGSESEALQHILTAAKERDPRVLLKKNSQRQGIAKSTNQALSLSQAPWVCFVDHDDEIPETALAWLAHWIENYPQCQIIYTDEDKIDVKGRHFEPFCKPNYSPHLLQGCNYIGHLVAVKRELLEAVGRVRQGFEGAQDYDLLLRLSRQTERFEHLPQVLYHWRQWSGSTAVSPSRKGAVADSTRRAVQDHLNSTGKEDTKLVETEFSDRTAFSRKCSILTEDVLLHVEKDMSACSLANYFSREFMASVMDAVHKKDTSLILFFHPRLKLLDTAEVSQLLALCEESDVAIAGGAVHDTRGIILDAGCNLTCDRRPVFPFAGLRPGNPGYLMLARVESNVLAPCVHLFAAKRDVLLKNYRQGQNFIELCAFIIERGYYNVCRPFQSVVCREFTSENARIPENVNPEIEDLPVYLTGL